MYASAVCEASGMLGQQYVDVESMVWDVSKWCVRSAVCWVSGVGSMVCMVSDIQGHCVNVSAM